MLSLSHPAPCPQRLLSLDCSEWRENGEWETAPLFSGEEVYTFPEPLGPCTVVYHAHEEVYTVPRFIKGVKKMNVKVGWQPTLFIAKAVMELGLLSDKPIDRSIVALDVEA